ncbi:hypothetical protein GC163_13160 [bacterium]|nr:hypothetical protein [bacterium]
MTATYPNRDRCFAHKFCRLLAKVVAAQEIGPEGCWLLDVIAHQEDAKHYRGPVLFYNSQLMSVCGFASENRLIRIRQRCIDAGWLNYESGGNRKPGLYWVTIPEGMEAADSPMDESDSLHIDLQNGGANGSRTEAEASSASIMEVETEVERRSSESSNGGSSTLSLLPNSISSEQSSIAPSPSAENYPDSNPIILEFPTKQSGQTWPLRESKVREYESTFPRIDVLAELRKARQWCSDNPGKRKTAKGMPKFLGAWLAKADSEGNSRKSQPSVIGQQPPKPTGPLTELPGDLSDVAAVIRWFRGHWSQTGLQSIRSVEVRVVACALRAARSATPPETFTKLIRSQATSNGGEPWSDLSGAELQTATEQHGIAFKALQAASPVRQMDQQRNRLQLTEGGTDAA